MTETADQGGLGEDALEAKCRGRGWWQWAPPIFLLGIVAAQSAWIWGRVGDLLIDFGDQLYVPWQLSTGKVLYRDVFSVFGLFSSYFNAGLMWLFGANVHVILTANLVLLGAAVVLIYFLLRSLAGGCAAFAATFFFITVFALTSPTQTANYNFLTPYSHQITHGFFLCLLMLGCLDRFCRSGSIRWAAAGGAATGLAFLTKPEIFLACAATFWLGLAGAMWVRRDRRVRVPLLALGAMAAPAVIAFALLATVEPAMDAFVGVSSGWFYISSFVVGTPFYQTGMGVDHLGDSIWLMAECCGIYLGIVVFLSLAGLLGGRLTSGRKTPAIVIGIALGIAGYFLIPQPGRFNAAFSPDMFRGLAVFALATVIAAGVRLIRANPQMDAKQLRRAAMWWSLSVFSMVMLAKIILNVRTYHYGFVLTAPCGMLAVIALMGWLPTVVERMGGSGIVVRLGVVGLMAGVIGNRLIITEKVLESRSVTIPLASGGTMR